MRRKLEMVLLSTILTVFTALGPAVELVPRVNVTVAVIVEVR